MADPVQTMPTLQSRQALLRRRSLRSGWLMVAVGVLVPVLALWGGVVGWRMRHVVPTQGWALAGIGTAVFAVRLALWLS